MNILLNVQHGWIVKDTVLKYFRTKPKWSSAQNKWCGNYRNTAIIITSPCPWPNQNGGEDKIIRIANGKFVATTNITIGPKLKFTIDTDGNKLKFKFKNNLTTRDIQNGKTQKEN